jgi:hypothetical protein
MRALAACVAMFWFTLASSTVCATTYSLTITETGSGITASQTGFEAVFTYGLDGESVTAVLTSPDLTPVVTGTQVFPVQEYWGGPPSDYLSVNIENGAGGVGTTMTVLFQSDVSGVPLVVPPTSIGGPTEYTDLLFGFGFSNSFVETPTPEFWIRGYDLEPPEAAPVPLPPAAFLLGSGLIPLAWAVRKKRLGK